MYDCSHSDALDAQSSAAIKGGPGGKKSWQQFPSDIQDKGCKKSNLALNILTALCEGEGDGNLRSVLEEIPNCSSCQICF